MSEETKFRRSENNPGALISVDHSGLQAYRAKKKTSRAINNMMAEHDMLKNDVADLRRDVSEVMGLLREITRMIEK